MNKGNRVIVRDPKSVFAGHVGEVVRITTRRVDGRLRYQIWVVFHGHPWQKDTRPFGFTPAELILSSGVEEA